MAFIPRSGIEPKAFVGRQKEFELFEGKIRDAENGKCDHFVVLGDWGIGKTVLLKEFKKRAQEKGFLTSMMTPMKFTLQEDLADATKHFVENITRKLPIDLGRLKKFIKQIESFGIQSPMGGFQFSKSIEKPDPQVFLLDSLLALWKDLKNESKVVPILIDDVQNFDKISEIFTLIKNILSDDEIVKTGYLFILSCTPDSWRKFMKLHHPIGRYFTPRLTLKRLSEQQTFEVVDKTLKGTGVVFDPEIREMIYEFTQGHPYELQVLGANLYDREIKGKVTRAQWPPALNETLLTLGEEVWDDSYNEASESEKVVLYLVSLSGSPVSRKTIVELAKKHKLGIPEASISKFLVRLVEKKLLSKPKKFEYACPDKLFKEYILGVKGLDGEGNVL